MACIYTEALSRERHRNPSRCLTITHDMLSNHQPGNQEATSLTSPPPEQRQTLTNKAPIILSFLSLSFYFCLSHGHPVLLFSSPLFLLLFHKYPEFPAVLQICVILQAPLPLAPPFTTRFPYKGDFSLKETGWVLPVGREGKVHLVYLVLRVMRWFSCISCHTWGTNWGFMNCYDRNLMSDFNGKSSRCRFLTS